MSDVNAIKNFVKKYQALKTEIAKVIIGQDAVIDQILIVSKRAKLNITNRR